MESERDRVCPRCNYVLLYCESCETWYCTICAPGHDG